MIGELLLTIYSGLHSHSKNIAQYDEEE